MQDDTIQDKVDGKPSQNLDPPRRNTKNVKYDRQTGQLLLDETEGIAGKASREVFNSAKFEESKEESRQIVEENMDEVDDDKQNGPGDESKVEVSQTDMSNLQIINQVSFGSKNKMGEEYDKLEKLFPVENEQPLAAFGFE